MHRQAALIILAIAVQACGGDAPPPAAPFPGGATQEAFVPVGELCATRGVDEREIILIASQLDAMKVFQTVNVDVWVHILTGDDEDEGAITSSAVTDQINVLNQSFSGSTGGAPTRFVFTHAGTKREKNQAWFTMAKGSAEERAAKSKLRVGGRETLNIYTADPTGADNWATFPQDYLADPTLDGVVVHYESLPSGNYRPWNLGDIAVHETGHWLGLYHTSQGGCSITGDGIPDTPAEDTQALRCPVNRDTCSMVPGNDPIRNFMDYTDDSCRYEFSADQSSFMNRSWDRFRK